MHLGVACDGCQTSPILGVRYKCAICKNFDYCSACEELCIHDHAFLKIQKPGHAFEDIEKYVDLEESVCPIEDSLRARELVENAFNEAEASLMGQSETSVMLAVTSSQSQS